MKSLFKKLKRRIKKGINFKIGQYEFIFKGKKIEGKPSVIPSMNSPTQNDFFENNFQFNMFVESNLDIEVKRKIIAQQFYLNRGYYPNIMNPKTFSEKVLWLKLFYYDPRIEKACDKYYEKEYVESVLGPGYTVPIIKKYDDVFDIKLEELPNSFALKVNWATGCNIIVKDKSKVNIEEIRCDLDRWTFPWKSSYYGTFNRGYRDVKPIIFAEEYIDTQ